MPAAGLVRRRAWVRSPTSANERQLGTSALPGGPLRLLGHGDLERLLSGRPTRFGRALVAPLRAVPARIPTEIGVDRAYILTLECSDGF